MRGCGGWAATESRGVGYTQAKAVGGSGGRGGRQSSCFGDCPGFNHCQGCAGGADGFAFGNFEVIQGESGAPGIDGTCEGACPLVNLAPVWSMWKIPGGSESRLVSEIGSYHRHSDQYACMRFVQGRRTRRRGCHLRMLPACVASTSCIHYGQVYCVLTR